MSKIFKMNQLFFAIIFLASIFLLQSAYNIYAIAAEYDSDTVKSVQESLNEAGYDCGTADGIAGSKTNDAISKYQEDHELNVSGTIDEELLVSLGIAEEASEIDEFEIDDEDFSEKLREIILENLETLIGAENFQYKNSSSGIASITFENSLEMNVGCIVVNSNPFVYTMPIYATQEYSMSDDGSSVFFDFLAYVVQSYDESLTFDNAYTVLENAIEKDGEDYINNGIIYQFNKNMFRIYDYSGHGVEILKNSEEVNYEGFGSTTAEFEEIFIARLESKLDDRNAKYSVEITYHQGIIMMINDSMSARLLLQKSDDSYTIVVMPVESFSDKASEEYISFLEDVIIVSDDEMYDFQAIGRIATLNNNEGEVYEYNNNYYAMEDSILIIQMPE